MITLDQYNRKIVITFTTNKPINQVRNMVKNKIEPAIDFAISNEFGADLTNLVIKHRDVNRSVVELGNNTFEIYPKTAISGTFNGTQNEFELRIDKLINQAKTALGNNVNVFGGIVVSKGFHVHRSTGRMNED